MTARTRFIVRVVEEGALRLDAEFSMLESALAHIEWIHRHHPDRRILFDVLPPVDPDTEFEEQIMAALRTPLPKSPVEQVAQNARKMGERLRLQVPRRPSRPMSEALDETPDDNLGERLAASWWQRKGTHRGPNPFETLVQKATREHHAVVERVAEEALQGGQYGFRVDVYPTRTEAHVDPTVPYGHSVEHQHLTDPKEEF